MARHLRRDNSGKRRRGRLRLGGYGTGKIAAGLLALTLAATLAAQDNQAQRAIERLEACSKQERKQDCVKVLKRKRADNGKLSIKAQVRGERIIWYEFDPESGRARRTN